MADPIKSVLVVGGGTAGWMAAAALNRSLGPHCKVSLVESDDIGIVGVGEATVPPIRDFNALIGLDEAEFMRETRATLKIGIEFVDWGSRGNRYLHPFGTFGPGPTLSEFQQSFLALRAKGRIDDDLDAYSLCAQACKAGKAGARDPDPRSPLNALFTAYHFDAGLYARYLRKVCEGRGVERIEGEIVDVVQRPDDGFIDRVRLKDGRELSADLFIDCTGFRALLIEGALKAGFEDWSHWLPMNRAWAVPCERVGPTTPFTRSTARDAGWQWRIALQHRTGNGHVYCSDFMGDDEARQILLDNLDGPALAEPRPLRFTTGRRKAFWSKNVVALGLSSGFIEPLESTSIHMVQSGIYRLLQHFPDSRFSPVNIETYNRRLGAEVALIRDFVILHYHATQRDDTAFWRHMATMPIPDTLSQRVEAFRDRGLLYQSGADEYFSQGSWLAVMYGQGIMPTGHNPLYDLQNLDQIQAGFGQIARRWTQTVAAMPGHDEFLKASGMWAGAT
ncbi:tryptophan halogenase family protein [Brevundimonas subvibrioides]|uniref:Pyridine nucleotide-disulfide oxidoreductase n=1 Tax=Brevundimonas subvibrioides (strain ATCC 15264 / DSM 4735 / LMG 14903 / NBRC 16000 / CB 81) TaxID=633149 RepID=D9QNH4_BRESC|nr:tryptophan halogenase family protein [Brevundimonas subvibrioides]ADL02209.1 pyridine nucleotide-disulfide oxidoreductase [Brevundimonas subvibrioides ATCC 15264]